MIRRLLTTLVLGGVLCSSLPATAAPLVLPLTSLYQTRPVHAVRTSLVTPERNNSTVAGPAYIPIPVDTPTELSSISAMQAVTMAKAPDPGRTNEYDAPIFPLVVVPLDGQK